MPRVLSSTMLQAMYAQETGEVPLVLIKIDHDDLPEPLRVTSDGADTISDGETYIAYPFEIVLPDEPEDGRSPRARLQISNVDRQIVRNLRGLSGAPSFDLTIVRAGEPDLVEASWPRFSLRNALYDSLYVQGELSLDDVLQLRYPADSYLPSLFPGLF